MMIICRVLLAISVVFSMAAVAQIVSAQQTANAPWHFLASGDSRNCGDVVMPAIAETAKKYQAAFYWHLGDLRLTTGFDEDIAHQPEHIAKPLSVAQYEQVEWPDYIESQIAPFGSIPFFLGIGNHETVPPLKTREEFLLQFADKKENGAHKWRIRLRQIRKEKMVGAVRFELTTSCTRNKRASQATLRPDPRAGEGAGS